MKKKMLIAAVLILMLAAALLYNVYNGRAAVVAQLEKDRDAAVAKGEDFVVARGKNIEVYNSDVQQLVHQYTYWKTGGTFEDAVNQVAGWAAVAYHAEKSGVTVSDEEIRDYIALQKSAGKDAANYAEFEAFVKAAGMTADEYWDAQYNIFRYELLRGKFDEYADKSAEEREKYTAEKLRAEKLAVLR